MVTKKQYTTAASLQTFGLTLETIILSIEKIKMFIFSLAAAIGRHERVAEGKLSTIRSPKFNFNKRGILKVIIPLMIFLVIIIAVFSVFSKKEPSVAGVSTNAANETGIVTTKINRTFQFPLKDEKGKEVGKFTYNVESAELRHHIVVKGQSATSVPGRVFLIVNLKIINTLNSGLKINSRDYIRISVNGNGKEWFAPDIHNDPVEAQAISTTPARIGLAINETDKDIRLQIGEIDGKKEIIPVSLNK